MRRRIVTTLAALAAAAGLLPAAAAADTPPLEGSENALARTYHELLQQHTRWAETTWDASAGSYELRDFNFAVVLGNAVILRFGSYDAQTTGVSEATLRDHTLRTIERFAASNRWVDPDGDWGGQIFWDSTFESYFVAAAKVMWDKLDPATRGNVDRIAAGAAEYVAQLRDGEDPRSGGWSSNGLLGGFRGDSKIEEMGAKSMPLATGLAHVPDAPGAPAWREWLTRWTASMGGLPSADRANDALLEGAPVSSWTRAQNVFDTFIVENHNSFAPIYQASMGAYPGRNAVHFLLAGRPLPDALRTVPNGDELSFALDRMGTDSGLPKDVMIADRHHLYGRNVLPLAYRSAVVGDPYALRAEHMLAERLGPYVAYPPADRLTKFSGEPKYEPEARAEVAMAYLLHYARASLGTDSVQPVSEREWFAGRSGVTDFGRTPGLVAHQTERALSAASTKPGYTKFAWVPEHDDWFLDATGGKPSLLPSASLALTGTRVRTYSATRDGYDASATTVRTAAGIAGFATLPGGEAVYATSGLAADEGPIEMYNLDMPGIRGLDGDRTITWAGGREDLEPIGLGDGGEDVVRFPATTARHVRFAGVRPATIYGYSLYDFEVRAGDGPDLARGRPTTASSYDAVAPPGPFTPAMATDGDPATRWAVSRAERGRPDSWLAVDLGSPQPIDTVVMRFDVHGAYGVQVSDDGVNWRHVAGTPPPTSFDDDWVNIDDRAGLVVRGSENPIRATPTRVTLSAGPAAGARGMVVEARPGESPDETAARAVAPAPAGGPDGLRASLAGGHLSLFNLSGAPIEDADLTLPQHGERMLFRGSQRTTGAGTVYEVDLEAADARVEAPRFGLAARHGDAVGLDVDVEDSRTLAIRNAGDRVAQLTVRSVATGERHEVTVPGGSESSVAFTRGARTPRADLAVGRTTFPTSPLPAGTGDPDLAVDGDDATTWRPGPDGRMVVDLGSVQQASRLELRFGPGRIAAAEVEVSDDGLDYRAVGGSSGHGREAQVNLGTAARYVAVRFPDWRPDDAEVATLAVTAGLTMSKIEPVHVAEPGGSATVAAEVENPGATPAPGVTVDLTGPEGWTVTPTATGQDPLPPGERARWSWELTAPADAAPGRHRATATLRYESGGQARTVTRDIDVLLAVLPKAGMAATADSAQEPTYAASRAIDGDPSTLWHSQYSPFEPLPHEITLDLGAAYEVTGVEYLPRQDGNANGTITRYRIEVSAGGDEWTPVATGTWPGDAALKSAGWERTTARFVRVVAEDGGGGFASAAELAVYGTRAE